MKNYKIAFCCLLFLTMAVLFSSILSAYADSLFDGGNFENYENNYHSANIPMPTTPSPPPRYSNSSSDDSDDSTPTHSSSTPVHKKSSYDNWGIQAGNEVADSIFETQRLKALKAKQEAEKQAKIQAQLYAQEQAKQKKQAENWLKDYKVDSLKADDPVKIKSDYKMPALGQLNDLSKQEFKVPVNSIDHPVINRPIIKATQNRDYGPAKGESQLRETYFKADRELMQCANGAKECTPEYVKTLQMKRLTAEQQLSLHYNYKEVNGQFMKKP